MFLKDALELFGVSLPEKHAKHCAAGNGEEVACGCGIEQIINLLNFKTELGIKGDRIRELQKLLDEYEGLNKD